MSIPQRQITKYMDEPYEISSYVFFPPEALTPLPSRDCNLPCQIFVRALAIGIPAKEDQRIMEIREVQLDWDIVDPGSYSVCIPDCKMSVS